MPVQFRQTDGSLHERSQGTVEDHRLTAQNSNKHTTTLLLLSLSAQVTLHSVSGAVVACYCIHLMIKFGVLFCAHAVVSASSFETFV